MSIRAAAYDSFTEAGTATSVNITSHTPEIGGSWSVSTDINAGWRFYIDANTDLVRFEQSPISAAGGDMSLLSTSVFYVNALATVTPGTASTGGIGIQARCIGTNTSKSNNSYLAYVGAGTASNFAIYRKSAGSYSSVATVSKTLTPPLNVRLQLTDSSPTTIRARLWQASDSEPSTWDIDTTNNQASNQTASPAPVGIYGESSSSTNRGQMSDLLVIDGAGNPVARMTSVTRAAVF